MNYGNKSSKFEKVKLNTVLRDLRKAKHMSQQEVADILGINRSSLSYYEKGKTEPIIKTYLAFCVIYNITLDELLNRDSVICNSRLVTNVHEINLTNQEAEGLTQYERQLLKYFNKMDNQQQSQVMERAMTILENEN